MRVEPAADEGDLVRVQGLSKTYFRRGPLGRRPVRAVAGVDLRIAPGASVAVVGGSGAGKSTLARCLARLEEPSAGRIWIEGHDLLAARGRELVLLRRRIQLVFQDTGWALDPRLTATEIVGEPLRVAGKGGARERRERTAELMAQVGLAPALAGSRPLEMSGGQRQRLAIARALAADPRLLVLDEALTGLDLSIQSQIVDLVLGLQAKRRLTCLWVSHDLPLMAHVASEILVMHEGRIVERGSPSSLTSAPRHPHTRALVASAEMLAPQAEAASSPPAGAEPEPAPPAARPPAAWALAYLARRALHGALLLVGVSLLSFVLLELAPGDFFDEMRLNPQISPATLAALRAEHGLDRPLPERYASWVGSAFRGDLGYSFAYGSPVAPLLWDRARNTLVLAATGGLGSWLVAIPIGVWWATRRRGGRADGVMAAASSTLLAIPDLVLALGLLLLALRTGAFPTGGMVSLGFAELDGWRKAGDLAWHLALPALALVVGSLPVLLRHVRAGMVEVLASPFVRAARGHGIPRGRLLFRHALPAAAGPLVSLFGLSVATLLSGSLMIEVVMSWPGLGPLLLEAILARDLHLVIGPVMASTFMLVAGNLLADVLLYVTDPRIRAE